MKRLSSSSSSSDVEVLSNDDLLAKILSGFSVRSLICLKLVSKQWISFVTSKQLSIIPRRRTTAIFLQFDNGITSRTKFLHLDPNSVNNSRLDNSECRSVSADDPFRSDNVRYLQSCHGLLLCRTGGVVNRYNQPRNGDALYYYVYNPTTNRVATIRSRRWQSDTSIFASVLVFDPDKSPDYKVVFFVNMPPHTPPGQMLCNVYSSETGTWKFSSKRHWVPPNITMRDFVYFKGSIYWTFESSLWSPILCYNVDEDVLGTLQRPAILPEPPRPVKRCHLYFGESAGHLHFVQTYPRERRARTSLDVLDVYELDSHRSGWVVKYRVDLTQLTKYFPGTIGDMHTCHKDHAFDVFTLVRREDIDDEDSVLVLEMAGQYIVYNLIKHTWKVIGQTLPKNSERLFCADYKAFDYIESLAHV